MIIRLRSAELDLIRIVSRCAPAFLVRIDVLTILNY